MLNDLGVILDPDCNLNGYERNSSAGPLDLGSKVKQLDHPKFKVVTYLCRFPY